MTKEDFERGYKQVVAELADRAGLILSESGRKTVRGAVCQSLDDGFIYDDDRASVLAWALECGLIDYGGEVDWGAIEESLIDDIIAELGERE